MPSLALSFSQRGLEVTGETFTIRELLKAQGGRWDPALVAWTLAFDGKQKLLQGLLDAGSDVAALCSKVEDNAKVNLTLGLCARGLILTGSTFPVKEILKNHGGVWNAASKGWLFQGRSCGEFAKVLRSCPDIGTVSFDDSRENLAVSVATPLRHNAGNSAAVLTLARPSGVSGCMRDEKQTPSPPKCSGGGSRGVASTVKRLRGKQGAKSQPAQIEKSGSISKNHKVVEVGKQLSKAELRKDGSRADTQVMKKERKISCRQTGAHVQTESVTKRKRVVETDTKIVETRTIVIKNVRSKPKMK